MKNILFQFFLSILVFFNANAQNSSNNQHPIRICASPKINESYEEAFQQMIQQHQQFANGKTTFAIYNIPVIFHVIHASEAINSFSATAGRNLNAAQINSQLTVLNEDYRKLNSDFSTYVTQSSFVNAAADVQINFCMAKVSPSGAVLPEPGIDRIDVASQSWTALPYTMAYIESTIKPSSSWDPAKYFNVWILEFGGLDANTLGYAQFPTIPTSTLVPISDMYGYGGAANTDGVVIDYKYIGNTGTALASFPYNKGRTLTHETGHWLGLWHIWGDDGGSCSGSDRVTDTPNQDSENYTCPSIDGSISADACSGTSGAMYQNYMDYSDDKCLVMFTYGQKLRMQAVMANCVRRNSLTTSTVCAFAGIEDNSSNINMEVFPNPTKGELFLEISTNDPQDFTISILNTLGQTVKEVKGVQSNNGKIKIDLFDKGTGVYFVNVKSKFTSKVISIVLQ